MPRKSQMSPTDRGAANLREQRLRTGMTQQELADRAGPLHRTEISLLERGGREPRLSTIVALARALRMPVADLLKGVS